MIYMQGDGLKIIVLETANLEELRKGRPAKTPDGSVLIAWTPDLPWLGARLTEAMREGADSAEIGLLIDEASKRPENPTPPRKA